MSADIRIGTSGWHYKHWIGTFYPERWPASKMLGFYLERFDTVEINNSFYRLPAENCRRRLACFHAGRFLLCGQGQQVSHAYEKSWPIPFPASRSSSPASICFAKN